MMKMSAGSTMRSLCALLVFYAAGVSCDAGCSQTDTIHQVECINSHQAALVEILLQASADSCDNALTEQRCGVLSDVVVCLNGKEFQNDSCRLQFDFTKINPVYKLPCSLERIYELCPDIPQLKGLSQTRTTSNNPNDKNGNDNMARKLDATTKASIEHYNEDNDINSSLRHHVTWFLLMTTLVTSFVSGLHYEL